MRGLKRWKPGILTEFDGLLAARSISNLCPLHLVKLFPTPEVLELDDWVMSSRRWYPKAQESDHLPLLFWTVCTLSVPL